MIIATKLIVWLTGAMVCHIAFKLTVLAYLTHKRPTMYGLLLVTKDISKYKLPLKIWLPLTWLAYVCSWFGLMIVMLAIVMMRFRKTTT
jgi:hypothetical protein